MFFAWVIARGKWPGKSVLETILLLPLVMPPIATGLFLIRLLSRNGPLGDVLHWLDFQIVFTWRAVVIAATVMSFPLFLRTVTLAWAALDPAMEEMGYMLGASHLRVWVTIVLPLLSRSILSGALLSFARALGEFGATAMIAGNIPDQTTTLSLGIYTEIQLGDDAEANRYLFYLATLALAAVAAGEWVGRKTKVI
jgi:molybdate transport system permease protein